jgi:hypothetical protein
MRKLYGCFIPSLLLIPSVPTLFSDILELHYGTALKAVDRKKGHIPFLGSSGIVCGQGEALIKIGDIIVGRKGNVGSILWLFNDFTQLTQFILLPPKSVFINPRFRGNLKERR